MNRTHTIALLTCLTLAPAAALAQAQRYVPYKGQLERDGIPVTGQVTVVFELWDDPTAGMQLHTETRQVVVTGGNFATQVGPVPEAVFTAAALYLALSVDGTPLGGRQLIQTAPYAVRGQPGIPFRVDALQVAASGGAASLTVAPGGTTLRTSGGLELSGPLAAPSAALSGDLSVVGNVTLSGGISSPRLGAFVAANATPFTNTGFETTFSDPGGLILIHVAATAYCVQTGRIGLTVTVDNVQIGRLRVYCGTGATHTTFPAALLRVDRNNIAAPAPGAPAITRTLRITPVTCPCTAPLVQTFVDVNDIAEVTIVRLPQP